MLFEFYDGSYGPTLRLWTDDASDLLLFAEVCRRMADEVEDEVELLKAMNLHHEDVVSITLYRDNERDQFEGRVSISNREQPKIIRWTESCAGWNLAAARLIELVRDPVPAHQYLAEDRYSDAMIEVSFLE